MVLKSLRSSRLPSTLLAASLAALSASCSKPSEPDPSPRAEAKPEGSAASVPKPKATASKLGGPADVFYDVPAGWQKVENPNAMRKATYKITRSGADAEDGELTVSQVGGTADLNIKRWGSQFEPLSAPAQKTEKEVSGLKVTRVEMRGTYRGMAMPGAESKPKDGYALLGAIVETSPPTFFKLTGPEKTVIAARGDFDKLVDSIRPK